MVIDVDTHRLTVKPRQLLEAGLNPAVLWSVDREKNIDSYIFIVATLKNGYNQEIVSVLKEYFGKKMILDALCKYQMRVSDKLYNKVITYLNH